MSIHINAGGGTGFESYVYPGVSAPTTTYRNALHDEIVRSVDFARTAARKLRTSTFFEKLLCPLF
ncbi:hypothetical protein BsIDN1_32200 [Bacillus safensis]|uniref:MurNAc-LAA domain-containing protein n=1 Tax=Bacillus safensis TaxID=561879 RepID=A0A5S9MAJ0_BACIA|nr:hypothetical protein BsIDN1_32200 [Bacillus safensis]